jgi:hypothetical protein
MLCSPGTAATAAPQKPRRRTGNELEELQHPLLGDQPTLQLLPPRDAVGAALASCGLQPQQACSFLAAASPVTNCVGVA